MGLPENIKLIPIRKKYGALEDDLRSTRKIKQLSMKKSRKLLSEDLRDNGSYKSETNLKEGLEVEADCVGDDSKPNHLIVMVNGLAGKPSNFRYAAGQFVKHFPNVIVHCSESNSSRRTFHGVDVMGDRLAEEVISVILRHPNLQKISFLGHSVGGLVARYAIAKLYGRDPTHKCYKSKRSCRKSECRDACKGDKFKGKIAGLEPMNFITTATPHLGLRANKQVPMLCGFHTMEKVATCASRILGKTVRHLFLTDSIDEKPPLLLQMVKDNEDQQFVSALQSFKRRVVYANTRGDILVGWCTSSLRRPNELPKAKNFTVNEKFPHVVNMDIAITDDLKQVVPFKVSNYRFTMEEKMLRGLTKANWDRIDVSFNGIKRIAFAHSTMQVKNYCINSDGADVISHMIHHFHK